MFADILRKLLPDLVEYAPDIKVLLNIDSDEMIKVSIKDLLPLAWKPVIV